MMGFTGGSRQLVTMEQISADTIIFSESVFLSPMTPTVQLSKQIKCWVGSGRRLIVIAQSAPDCRVVLQELCDESVWIGPYKGVSELVVADQSVIVLVECRSVLEYLRSRSYYDPGTTITVSGSDAFAWLNEFGALHFHVGTNPLSKHQRLVPLVEQWDIGLSNILEFFLTHSTFDLLTHLDLTGFPSHSARRYRTSSTASDLYLRAEKVAKALSMQFSEVKAVFGGGYPFYLKSQHEPPAFFPTPNSILKYLTQQSTAFSKRTVTKRQLQRLGAELLDPEQLRNQLNIEVEPNEYEKYEFGRFGYSLDPITTGPRQLNEYYSANRFDIGTDPWPCHLCSVLQNKNKFPHQRLEKDFSESCLKCRQTSFLPRNITGCTIDLDLIVVVAGEPASVSDDIWSFVESNLQEYLYDTDFPRTFLTDHGPLDLFLISEQEIGTAFNELANEPNRTDVFVDALALWLPPTKHSLDFAGNYVLDFYPLLLDESIRIAYERTCVSLATHLDFDSYVDALRASSFYYQQLLENPEVVISMRRRLKWWYISYSRKECGG